MTYNQRLHESRRILSTSTCSFLILDPLLLSVFAEGFLLFRSVAMDKVLRRTTGSMKSVSGCPFANIYPEDGGIFGAASLCACPAALPDGYFDPFVHGVLRYEE